MTKKLVKKSTKISKNCKKNTTKIYKKPAYMGFYKNPQENQKIISFCKNIKINVDITNEKRRDTLIGSADKYYFFFKRE
jgi:hypothetical protein